MRRAEKFFTQAEEGNQQCDLQRVHEKVHS